MEIIPKLSLLPVLTQSSEFKDKIADPDGAAHYEPPQLDLQCTNSTIFSFEALTVKMVSSLFLLQKQIFYPNFI